MVSVRRVAPVLLLVMALPAFAAKSSSTRPPRELHRVGDHWTAYNPPDVSTYPANARSHVIKSGDTLWALAKQYYGNAYLWPQLWESNTWITDAHWIYPGDVLLVEGEGSATAAATQGGAASTELTGGVTETTAETEGTGSPSVVARVTESRPIPLGTESDIYCYGYIGDPNEPMPNVLQSVEDVEVRTPPRGASSNLMSNVAEGDLVFITGGTSTGLVAGETYLAVEPGELIYEPGTRNVIGRHYYYNGQIRVLCAEDRSARAIIVSSCRDIHPGARLKPVPQLPIPIARVPEIPAVCDAPTNRGRGFIVDALEADAILGEGQLVQVNLGRNDEVQPGDFLTVYRTSPIAGQPPQVLGEIGILTSETRTSTGKIVAMRRTMMVGDMVQMR